MEIKHAQDGLRESPSSGSFLRHIDKFKSDADTYIHITSEETTLPLDVILMAGPSMRALGNDTTNGRLTFIIGLSGAELDMLRANPGKSIIRLEGKTYHISFDILIFSGESEIRMGEMFHELVGPETKTTFDPRTIH